MTTKLSLYIKLFGASATYLEELMKADMFGFRSVHLFTVLLSEEEPVSESHVKELGVFPVESDQVQPLTVAISATEERSRLPLLPGVSSRLLHCQSRQGNPDRPTEDRVQ